MAQQVIARPLLYSYTVWCIQWSEALQRQKVVGKMIHQGSAAFTFPFNQMGRLCAHKRTLKYCKMSEDVLSAACLLSLLKHFSFPEGIKITKLS